MALEKAPMQLSQELSYLRGSRKDITEDHAPHTHAPKSQELAALLRPPHEVDGADAARGSECDHKPAQHGPRSCLHKLVTCGQQT